MNFLRINNRKNFLLEKIPVLHPHSIAYLQYWRQQKRRCIEGFWSIDDDKVKVNLDLKDEEIYSKTSDKWRFMPPQLYFYVNFGTILHKEKGQKNRHKIRPILRDFEWEFFYVWLECRGFSGFTNDDEYSCHRDIPKYLENKDTVELPESCFNKKGELKKYVPAREYLRKLFSKPMGLPLYENQALGVMMLGTRGLGKSYVVGVGIILYGMLFDEAKKYDEESIKNPFKVEIFVGAADSAKSSDLLNKTIEAFQCLPGEYGLGTDEFKPAPFSKLMEGSLSPNNAKNPWRHEYEEKIGNEWKEGLGSKSYVKHGIYTVDNPTLAAGGRYTVMVYEETGLIANAKDIHGSNVATMVEGTDRFGSDIWLGTGGDVDKVRESEEIFRSPRAFGHLEFDDIWEGQGKIGWFVSSIYALNQFKDENGNTNVEAATAFRLAARAEAKKSKTSSSLDNELMNYPLIPSEIFLNAKGNRFPLAELKNQLAELKSKPHKYEHTHYFGDLVFNKDGILEWKVSSPRDLIREWPKSDNKDSPGVIEIFEMPKKDGSGKVFKNRYIQGTDTYDDDESSTNSLGSTFILDLWTDRIVAEYTGRRMTSEFYEICRKLNLFYSAVHNYENNKKGLYWHYEKKKSLHLLTDTPECLKDVMDYSFSKVGNKQKGTSVTKPVINYGLGILEEWLLTPAYGEENEEILNLHKIRSIALLQELIGYSDKANCDRVSALIMLMILKENMYKAAESKKTKASVQVSEDDFFKRNYNPHKTVGAKVSLGTYNSQGIRTNGFYK